MMSDESSCEAVKHYGVCRWVLICMWIFMSLSIPPTPVMAESGSHVKDPAFRNHSQAPVLFFHDPHNEAAGIDECNICHHIYEGGKLVAGDMSVGTQCSECHFQEAGKGRMDLIRAYHLQCKGCHQRLEAGPVMCGECHEK